MKEATWPTQHLGTGDVRTMLYEEEASLAMSWWSSMFLQYVSLAIYVSNLKNKTKLSRKYTELQQHVKLVTGRWLK